MGRDTGDEPVERHRSAETIERYEAAESQGLDWPYSCRGGACANYAAVLLEGEIDIDLDQEILPEEAIRERDIQLTCIGTPATEGIKTV